MRIVGPVVAVTFCLVFPMLPVIASELSFTRQHTTVSVDSSGVTVIAAVALVPVAVFPESVASTDVTPEYSSTSVQAWREVDHVAVYPVTPEGIGY